MPRAFIKNTDYWLHSRKPHSKPWAVGIVWPDTHRYFEFETWDEAFHFADLATKENK